MGTRQLAGVSMAGANDKLHALFRHTAFVFSAVREGLES
jgi:hypothetical protein